jgi:Fic family protein
MSIYIYQQENWPNFFWNQKSISDLLVRLHLRQGRLLGCMESVGFQRSDETVLQSLTQDVVKSSQIEGEILDQTLVRSSVARHLGMERAGLDVVDRNIEGVVEMTLDATQHYNQPLTKERILSWHASLFPNGRSGFTKITVGAWRTGPVQVVSGKMGKETVHFEAPSADRVDDEMRVFFDWVHTAPIDPVLKAAIAHLWFVTIHPFDDGNGRIGRAIADLLLAMSENTPRRFYSLSAQIQRERADYYAILEKTQKGTLDITPWIEWFFITLENAIDKSLAALDIILRKARFWETIGEISLNERQRKIINRLLDGFKGKLTSTKWAKINKCSQDTAYRDILNLIEKGILKKDLGEGRSTSYSLF